MPTEGQVTSPTDEQVYEALEEVIDPELGLDFVSLGLVYDVEIEGPEVFITFTLTTPACPIGPQVSEQMKEFVLELDGVEKVHPKMIFDPPWSPEMMSEDAKFALGSSVAIATARHHLGGVLMALCALGMLTELTGAAAAQAPAGLQLTTEPRLFPATFDETVTDYVVRCQPSNTVQVSVSAPEDATVSVDHGPQREGDFTQTVSPLSAGQSFDIAATSGGNTKTFFIRCLPSDFPAFDASRTGPTEAEWYAAMPSIGTTPSGVSRQYVMLFDNNGVPVWWMRSADTSVPLDAKLLPNGNVAWIHEDPGPGSPGAEEHRLDGSTVRTLNTTGTRADHHDIQLLPNGNYLLGRYFVRPGMDMSSCGGSTSRDLIDNEIQELTPSGDVRMWSWLASDHIPYSEVTSSWESRCTTGNGDIYHWNSVEPDGDGYVLSFRHLDAVYRIERATGAIDWKLGGEPRAESLTVDGDPLSAVSALAGQHDARVLGDGSLTIHDNGTELDRPPRAVRYAIDEPANTATLLEDVRDPDAPSSVCCGSTRRLPGGNWVSAWGANPYVTEQTSTGVRVFRLSFAHGFSYRANPVLPGQLSRAALREGMNEQYPRSPSPPPPPSDADPPPPDAFLPDTTPPRPLLGGPAAQRLGRTVKVRVSCDESCTVSGTGTVVVEAGDGDEPAPGLRRAARRLRVRLKPASASLAPGERRTLKLRLSNAKLKNLARAMKPPRPKAKAKLRIHATDAAGNEATRKWTVKLRR